jgi:hypothetical protein
VQRYAVLHPNERIREAVDQAPSDAVAARPEPRSYRCVERGAIVSWETRSRLGWIAAAVVCAGLEMRWGRKLSVGAAWCERPDMLVWGQRSSG